MDVDKGCGTGRYLTLRLPRDEAVAGRPPMSAKSEIGPALAPSRSILLPVSFAACGLLLFVLFVSLVGCGGEPFRSGGQGTSPQPIRCSCWCEYFHDPAVPSQILISASEDDGVQGSSQ